METTKLCDSCYCRLCAEENKNGTYLFSPEENSENLSVLINKYLPIKVENDNKFPSRICPGCHIQLEATKLFMDLIIQGQLKLRKMYQKQQETFQLQEKHRQQLQEALQSVNPKSTVQSYTIQTNEAGVIQSFIEIFSDGPLFPSEHQLSLLSEGIDKPKRKRGRPPKQLVELKKECSDEEEKEDKNKETEEIFDGDGRRRRKIKPPIKYEGVIQGKELDKMLQEEGIEEKVETPADFSDIIGRIESSDSKESGQPVYFHKPRSLVKIGIKKYSQGKQSFQCGICTKQFLNLSRYDMHLKSCHNNLLSNQKSEAECNTQENNVLDNHQVPKDPGVSILRDLDTISHISDFIEESGTLTDPILNDSKENLTAHVKAEYMCTRCFKVFPSIDYLESHSIEHKNESMDKTQNDMDKQYTCNLCSKPCRNPSSLLYHKETEHNTGKRYVCNKCPKGFKLRQQLLRHQKVHSEERPYQCTKCPTSFKSQSNLFNHQIVHTGEKKFCCTICGKRFPHKTSLTLHMRWHDGEKPFQCNVCLKSFTQKGNLTEHMRIHTGEKPFCCDQCGRSFTTSSQFHLHMKRHTGEKPWVCNYCSKSFLHNDTYKAHIRRHLNERPFKCRICMRSFPESWALKRHQRIHTKEKPYSCQMCDKTFADSSNRLKHLKTHMQSKLVKTSNDSSQTHDNNLKMIIMPKSTNTNIPNNLQLTQLCDSQGNPINITMSDGQTIPVVTEGDENIVKGLLPDGTLVPIDLDKNLSKESEISDNTDLLEINESDIVSLNESELIQSEDQSMDTSIQNIQFMTGDDGQEMCLITYGPLDNNESVINTDLNSSLFLTSM